MKDSDKKLINDVAPCSLLCYTCPGYKDGAITSCATQMCNYFKGYYDFNNENLPLQYRGWLPEFEKFHDKLERYTKGSCAGCRNNQTEGFGCMKGCFIEACTKEHGVYFCGECSEFPCNRAKEFFSKNRTLLSDWLRGSARIKDVGIHQYFDEKKDTSHYISYAKDVE